MWPSRMNKESLLLILMFESLTGVRSRSLGITKGYILAVQIYSFHFIVLFIVIFKLLLFACLTSI
ncbi:hypothetical protein HanPI659440_Chr14g0545241 [Helianthus annuus]|nr:hypothetical protein HanPI659440_Chr14g0545241 [Helianthus annuus]